METQDTDLPRKLSECVAGGLVAPVAPQISVFAAALAEQYHAQAVMFYGSNLRSRSLDGVLDFYVLQSGQREQGLWPRVAYHEQVVVSEDAADGTVDRRKQGEQKLQAKVAVMNLATFLHAAGGYHLDTTVWTRFVQPAALVWQADDAAGAAVNDAICQAVRTAAQFAAVLGPREGTERSFWQALFRATYRAELRIEKPGREEQILDYGAAHFDGLLTAAWDAAGIAYCQQGDALEPLLSQGFVQEAQTRWERRRLAGKPLNLVRLLRAAMTFNGGARYLAWKVERHTGARVPLSAFAERHPLLSLPAILSAYLGARRRARSSDQPASER
ncbi:hypothetical protein RM533_04285 [Croceicoccus sp. F390]|uniref:Uncharacterized protein n=1 Tax=Croceicoccus esteveae TaxID=3075597 RepID=A0ABU2ZIJ1_9SPHN|nr:hypothetical protein [Croceicoccus sp. F390]MDT0575399.1 hypothetical protein [Croceicoccus sp. F390]